MSQDSVSLFAVAGQDGARLVSADGQTWKHPQSGKEGETYRGVAFGNGRVVAVGTYGGGNLFAWSSDGAAWKASFKDSQYKNYLRGLIFLNGAFVALGGDPGSVGDSKPFIVSSKDGEAWGEAAGLGGRHMIRRLAAGNGLVVGVGDRGRIAVSKDLRAWTDVPNRKAVDTLIDIAFGKGLFVGVGLHGLRMVSEDGEKWERLAGEEGEHLNSILWAGDRFVAVGLRASYASADGRTWTRAEVKDGPLTAAWGKGVFVGLAWKGRILRSTDGVGWTEVHKAETHFETAAFGELKA